MNIENKLNSKQFKAASSKATYLRIIAGAGTGKTRTLSYRIAYLIDQGVLPFRMVAITFTNKAAREMLDRVSNILQNESDVPVSSLPLISTFHGFCYRFLKKEIFHMKGFNNQFNVLDSQDQNSIYKLIFKNMTKGDSKEFVQAVVNKISSLKNDGVWPRDVVEKDVPLGAIYTYDELVHVYTEYQKNLKLQNMLDFDDLLMFTTRIMEECPDVRMAWQNKYDIFLVDEFQDTNIIQYNLVKLFMRGAEDNRPTKLTVVGDPDQTIYTWRGAKNDIIKSRLSKDFKDLETVVLDDNYRSTQHILDAANNLIRNNKDRMAKDLHAASNQEGEEVTYTNFSNSDLEGYSIASRIRNMVSKNECSLKDIAIIYRANYLSNSLEKQLASFKIPYQIYGGLKFYERAEIKDALSYLRVIINPDDISFLRILQAPTKGVGDKTIERARELRSQLGEDVMLFDVFRNHGAELKLNSKSTLAMNKFFNAYDRVVNVYRSKTGNAALLSAIREYFIETGFTDYVADEDKKSQEKLTFTASSSNSKVDNVNEFIRSLTQALDSPTLDEQGNPQESTLVDFLISVALQSDQDAVKDGLQVSLMTGHVSKGLEFPVVFVTGVNQAIFPSFHALMGDGNASIEEERRLFYVCCTRAQKKLYVSSFGGNNFRTGTPYMPSQFIKELGITKKQDKSQSSYTSNSGKNNYYSSMGAHKPTFGNTMHKPETAKIISASGPKKVDVNNDDNKYVIGDKVAHITFGVGVVEEVNGNKIKVKFNDPYGVKTLIIGFKAFRKVKED